MVDFVARFETAENGNGGFNGGFVNRDGLETALEGGVLAYRFPILIRYEDVC